MKISVRSILDFKPFEGHLFAVYFDGTNVLNSGGEVGANFPASQVTETLYELDYDAITVGNGFNVQVPRFISYLGTVDVTFIETQDPLLNIEKFITEWTKEFHNSNDWNSITSFAKEMRIKKFTTDDSVTKESAYMVLPPQNLTFSPSGSVDIYNGTASFPIIKVIKINE